MTDEVPDCPLWSGEIRLLESAARYLDVEAQTWMEGCGVPDKDGNWSISDDMPEVQLRHHNLVRTAERLRETAARLEKKRQASQAKSLCHTERRDG